MDAFNQPPSPQPTAEQTPAPPKPALNSKILFIALIVFIVIMSGLTAYLLAGRTKPISKPPPSISPTTSQPFPTIDPTANWKTYTNSKYEYSVKYPSDWDIQDNDIASKPEIVTFVKEPSRKGVDMHSRAVSITVESNPRKNIPTIEWYKTEWAKQIPAGINFDNLEFEETTFQDLPALKVSNTIFFARGIYMFRVEWGMIDFGNADPKLVELTKQTFDQILSTFKFTDQKQTPSPTSYIPNNPQIEEEGKLKVQNTPEVKTLIGKYGKSNVSIKALDVKLVKDIQFIMQLDPRFKEQTGCIIVVEVNNTGYVYQLDKDNEILYRQTLEEFKQKTANVDQQILEKFYSSLK